MTRPSAPPTAASRLADRLKGWIRKQVTATTSTKKRRTKNKLTDGPPRARMRCAPHYVPTPSAHPHRIFKTVNRFVPPSAMPQNLRKTQPLMGWFQERSIQRQQEVYTRAEGREIASRILAFWVRKNIETIEFQTLLTTGAGVRPTGNRKAHKSLGTFSRILRAYL